MLPSAGGAVGVDPRLLSSRLWDTLSSELAAAGHRLRPVHTNLVDLVWSERPARTANPVQPHPIRYSGTAACGHICTPCPMVSVSALYHALFWYWLLLVSIPFWIRDNDDTA